MYSKWWTENSSSTKFKGKRMLVGIVCIALLASTGCSLLPKEAEEEALPTISPPKLSQKPTYVVKTDTLETKVRGAGKMMAVNEEDIFFTQDGKRIKEIYVKSGDAVQKGQPIAELDVSDMERDLRQKRLQIQKEEIAMIEKLRGATEKTAEQLEQDRLDFELKRQELVKLEEDIAKAKITAPLSGTIVSVSMKKGDMSKAYESVSVIADLSELVVAATISAEDLKKVAVGMEVTVDINAAGSHKGKVKQLPSGKTQNNNNNGGFYPGDGGGGQKPKDSIDNYLVVQLDKVPDNVVRGTPLSVAVIIQRKENAVVIPLAALRSITGRNYVQVIDDKGSKREVDVEIGQQTPTDVEIVKGLTPGQKVVGR
ncbi:efflux RND transporter periplasmic adaptor subunit [Paenibacillus sp. MBLB4367]|uniref:efflux RND transporter periplasmic adaptor subunit n=1 Tax=Paenibacillus sp. MBLB4367 TaxID=3384767 RepID=UPI003907FB57